MAVVNETETAQALASTQAMTAFLEANGLKQPGESIQWEPLTGGVSSDIWRGTLPGRSVCVKRALPKLKVSADWQAPVSRNAFEWAWLQFAQEQVPGHVPKPLAHDPDAGLFAMEFLEAIDHPVWKNQLLAGHIDPKMAAAVGHILGVIHNNSAGREDVATTFASDDIFYAIRLSPYLLATAEKHPDVAAPLKALAERTAHTRHALVHGDVSPKNILAGPNGPVFIDAECAWYGDPAFDLAFCLNHMLLKGVIQTTRGKDLRESFDQLVQGYREQVKWEPWSELESRAASLLPGLLLARCDGKSPVEYLTREDQKTTLRAVAIPLLWQPPTRLATVADAWFASDIFA